MKAELKFIEHVSGYGESDFFVDKIYVKVYDTEFTERIHTKKDYHKGDPEWMRLFGQKLQEIGLQIQRKAENDLK